MKNHKVIFHNDISAMHGSAFKFHRCDKLLEFNFAFHFGFQLKSATSPHYLKFFQILADFLLPSHERVSSAAPL